MRYLATALIVFVGVLAVTHATESASADISKVEDSPFGKSLLDMLQLQFTTNMKDPVETITKALLNMRKELVADQIKEDTLHETARDDCIKYKKDLRKEIRLTKIKLAKAKEDKTTIMKENTAFKTQLDQSVRVEASIKENLARMETLRTEEKKRYDDEIAQISKQREGLVQAKNMISKWMSEKKGGSFLQEKAGSTFAQVRSQLQNSKSEDDYYNSLQNIAIFFVQLAEKSADEPTAQKIVDLLDKLVETLGDNEYQATQAETQRIKAYEDGKNKLEGLIMAETTKQASLKAKIEQNNQRTKQLANDINDYDRSIRQKKKEYRARKAQCNDNQAAYFKRKKDRTHQLQVIDTVIDFINERLDNVEEYIKKRSGSSATPAGKKERTKPTMPKGRKGLKV